MSSLTKEIIRIEMTWDMLCSREPVYLGENKILKPYYLFKYESKTSVIDTIDHAYLTYKLCAFASRLQFGEVGITLPEP